MRMNALIPMGVRPLDIGNALSQGIQIGGAYDDMQLNRAKINALNADAEYGSGASVFGTPIWGTDETGREGVGVIGKDGSFRLLDTGGFQPSRGLSFPDLGDVIQPTSKSTGLPAAPSMPKAGTPPQGYEPVEGGGYAPMPGTPQARELGVEQATAQNRVDAARRTSDVVTEDIDRALGMIDNKDGYLPTTGLGGAALQGVPGTQAYNLSQMLEGIKANIGFDKLQAMRDASPTGGALGQVAVQELEALRATYGSVLQSQDPEQLKFNLRRLREQYEDIVHGPQRKAAAVGATNPPPVSVSPPMVDGELPVYNSIPDPRGALYPEPGQPQGMNMRAAPEGTIISNGQKRLIKRAGQWVPI